MCYYNNKPLQIRVRKDKNIAYLKALIYDRCINKKDDKKENDDNNGGAKKRSPKEMDLEPISSDLPQKIQKTLDSDNNAKPQKNDEPKKNDDEEKKYINTIQSCFDTTATTL